MRAALARWVLRLFATGVIVCALAYIPYRVYGSEGYLHYRKLAREETELARGNEELRRENLRLRRENQRLRDDVEAVGDAARDDLGMVGAGDVVIQLEREAPPAQGLKQ